MSVADIRQNYEKGELLESQAKESPFDQFDIWLNEAIALPVAEPTAMTLATADASGKPTARIVLLKGFDTRGFVFYTNYESRKGKELALQTQATLLFFWQPLERQVRIEGIVEKVSPDESDEYYQSRPLGSRLGAWASAQSQPVTIEALKAKVEEVEQKFGDNPPRPPHWGGYRVRPSYFEFWQGRPSRLHDRLTYQQNTDGEWIIERLSP
ncbi:MAG: pyridoxamine 5'-phosphate oxidase [Burkholderiaceae bacterium]|nr:pyridoxamine 5'-phosphate oxidase [Burkholderiaceae bacterium]MCD8516588.1 pyridoxamine 5'-phosphate oxidase [Burkholderiaceae bacterium]MCD8565188.1 pyridoxamine 5'-phosphate oxidase [Burkholderiaceae bacterium]